MCTNVLLGCKNHFVGPGRVFVAFNFKFYVHSVFWNFKVWALLKASQDDSWATQCCVYWNTVKISLDQTRFNLDFYGCQWAQTKLQLLFGWETGLVACMRKVSIVSQQSRYLVPCEFLCRPILVPSDIRVCNFQAWLHLKRSCPFCSSVMLRPEMSFIFEGIVGISFTRSPANRQWTLIKTISQLSQFFQIWLEKSLLTLWKYLIGRAPFSVYRNPLFPLSPLHPVLRD